MSQRIAIVGGGIAGLTAAWYLSRDHQVTLFEAEPRLGGHTFTVDVQREHGDYAVDMGFIVFNDRTYPRFEALLAELGIGRQPTAMGFAVTDAETGVEYCGDGLGGFFGRRRNLLDPGHWALLRDILRFNREAPALLGSDAGAELVQLLEYLKEHLAFGGCGELQALPGLARLQFYVLLSAERRLLLNPVRDGEQEGHPGKSCIDGEEAGHRVGLHGFGGFCFDRRAGEVAAEQRAVEPLQRLSVNLLVHKSHGECICKRDIFGTKHKSPRKLRDFDCLGAMELVAFALARHESSESGLQIHPRGGPAVA